MTTPTIKLNIFTNSTASAPSTDIIEATYRSFLRAFCKRPEEMRPTIYLDSHPNINASRKYAARLYKLFGDLVEVESMSDGYMRSIKYSKDDYLFQLEHDWQFEEKFIRHSLAEILTVMQGHDIYHFRFNKRENKIAVWDKRMDEQKYANGNGTLIMKYCESNNLSNNPHIIDRKKYVDELGKYIQIVPGSKGIEEKLNAVGGLVSCVYGPLGYPATVTHLDGRRSR